VLGGALATLPLREARELFEREYLLTQINRFGGNISRTATFVGMERSALHRKLKSLGVVTTAKSGRASPMWIRGLPPGRACRAAPPGVFPARRSIWRNTLLLVSSGAIHSRRRRPSRIDGPPRGKESRRRRVR
jgi:hypothetical protein